MIKKILQAAFCTARLRGMWAWFIFVLILAVALVLYADEWTALILVIAFFPPALIILQKLESGVSAQLSRLRKVDRSVSGLNKKVAPKTIRVPREQRSVVQVDASNSSASDAPKSTDSSYEGVQVLKCGDLSHVEQTATAMEDFIRAMDSAAPSSGPGLSLAQQVSIRRVLKALKADQTYADQFIASTAEIFVDRVIDTANTDFLRGMGSGQKTVAIMTVETFEVTRSHLGSVSDENGCAFIVAYGLGEIPPVAPKKYTSIVPTGLTYGIKVFYPTARITY